MTTQLWLSPQSIYRHLFQPPAIVRPALRRSRRWAKPHRTDARVSGQAWGEPQASRAWRIARADTMALGEDMKARAMGMGTTPWAIERPVIHYSRAISRDWLLDLLWLLSKLSIFPPLPNTLVLTWIPVTRPCDPHLFLLFPDTI